MNEAELAFAGVLILVLGVLWRVFWFKAGYDARQPKYKTGDGRRWTIPPIPDEWVRTREEREEWDRERGRDEEECRASDTDSG